MFYLLSVREKVTFGGIMAEATDTFTNLGFDPDALRNKYREERDKRLRQDGNDQYIEVKGETSGDKTSSRYGKPFHSGQVFDMVSKVIFKALDNTNISEYNEKKDHTCIALPKVDIFQKYHAKVARYLFKLGIVTFLYIILKF